MSVEFLVATAIGALTAGGIYLCLRARTFPVVLGLAMLSYAINMAALRHAARQAGMRSLQHDAGRWLQQGVTSREEIARVTRDT